MDNRPQAIALKMLQEAANHWPRAKQLKAIRDMASHNLQMEKSHRWQSKAERYPDQKTKLVQKMDNQTGLPDYLKSSIENLSGYSMDDVKVHYNSAKPHQFQALAYAQGTDIHLASGQERYRV